PVLKLPGVQCYVVIFRTDYGQAICLKQPCLKCDLKSSIEYKTNDLKKTKTLPNFTAGIVFDQWITRFQPALVRQTHSLLKSEVPPVVTVLEQE
ncbi:MAG: hypothetical protein ACI8ZT_001980, partial [Bacteroidia bacterium]